MELREQLKGELASYDALAAKESKTDDESAKMLEHLERAEGLKAQIEVADRAKGVKDWSEKSTGVPPLGAKVVGTEPAGKTVIENQTGRVVLDEGAGTVSSKLMETLSSTEYKGAFRTYLRKGLADMPAAERKTLQEGIDDQGGFLVPLDVLNRIIAREPTPTNIAGRVTTLTTGRDRVAIPKVNYSTDDIYTTGIRVTWTGEVPSSSTVHRVTEPVFGQVAIPINTAMMSMPLTNDLIEDAMFPLQQWVADKFAETVDIFKDDIIINGSGIGRPEGILMNPNGTDQPATVNIGNPLTADGLQTLVWTLPPQYDSNGVIVFNKVNTGMALAKLKDGNNRYLWANFDDNVASSPMNRTFLGYPVLMNALMPNTGANNFPIIFGDLKGYYLVNRVGFSVQVLRELYAETNQILVLGRLRLGGLVAEPWRILIGKNA